MKRSASDKIPSVVLWLCTLITLFISIWFLFSYFFQSIDTESPQVSSLLYWLYILFIITVSTGLIFSFYNFIKQLKENPKKVGRSLFIAIVWGLLLSSAFVAGNGDPLPLVDYKGSENTYIWLKITDMWLYVIYFLLGLGFLALIIDIIWSYFKKLN